MNTIVNHRLRPPSRTTNASVTRYPFSTRPSSRSRSSNPPSRSWRGWHRAAGALPVARYPQSMHSAYRRRLLWRLLSLSGDPGRRCAHGGRPATGLVRRRRAGTCRRGRGLRLWVERSLRSPQSGSAAIGGGRPRARTRHPSGLRASRGRALLTSCRARRKTESSRGQNEPRLPPRRDGPEQRASSAGAIAERTAREKCVLANAKRTLRLGPQGRPRRRECAILAVRGCHVTIGT